MVALVATSVAPEAGTMEATENVAGGVGCVGETGETGLLLAQPERNAPSARSESAIPLDRTALDWAELD
jgi:hypothetical protein